MVTQSVMPWQAELEEKECCIGIVDAVGWRAMRLSVVRVHLNSPEGEHFVHFCTFLDRLDDSRVAR